MFICCEISKKGEMKMTPKEILEMLIEIDLIVTA